jgi:hypothetical protein
MIHFLALPALAINSKSESQNAGLPQKLNNVYSTFNNKLLVRNDDSRSKKRALAN